MMKTAAAPRRQSRQGQQQPGNFQGSKPRSFKNKAQNERWFFQQAGVRLLNISQQFDHVNVTLLRYTNSAAIFSTETVWKLPFKLKHIKSYLLFPYLSEEEKDDKELLAMLGSLKSCQLKFEELMAYRIKNIIVAIGASANCSHTKGVSMDNDWPERLCDIYNPKFQANAFIEEVIAKNHVKPVWKQ